MENCGTELVLFDGGHIGADQHDGNNLATDQSGNYGINEGIVIVMSGDPVLNDSRIVFDPILEHQSCQRTYTTYLKKFGQMEIPIGTFPLNEDITPSVENYKCARPTQCPYYIVEIKHRNKRFSKWVEGTRKTIETIPSQYAVEDSRRSDDVINSSLDSYFGDFQLSGDINRTHRSTEPVDSYLQTPAGYDTSRSDHNDRFAGSALNDNSLSFTYPSDHYPINQNHNLVNTNINNMNSAISTTNNTVIVPNPNHRNDFDNPGIPIYNVNSPIYSNPNNSHHNRYNHAPNNTPNNSLNSGFNRSSQPTPSHNDNNNSNDLYTESPNFNYIARPSHSLVTGPNQKRRTGKSGKHIVSKKSSSRNDDTNSNNISTGSISSTNGLNTSANDDLCGFLNTSFNSGFNRSSQPTPSHNDNNNSNDLYTESPNFNYIARPSHSLVTGPNQKRRTGKSGKHIVSKKSSSRNDDTNSNNISTGSISSTNGLNTSANDDLCGFLNTSFNSGFNRSSQPTPSHNDNNNSNDLYTESPNFNYIARPSHSLVTGPNQKRRTGKSGKHIVSKKSSSRNDDTNSNNISTGSISSTNGLNTSANDDLCGFLNTSFNSGFNRSSQPTPSHNDNNNSNDLYTESPNFNYIARPSHSLVTGPNQKRRTGKSGKHTVSKKSSSRNDTNSNNISTGSISSTNGLNTSANDDLCGFLNTSFNSGFNRSSQPTPSHNDNNNSNDLYTENPNFNYIARPSHSLVTGPNQKRRTGKSGKHTVSKKSSSRNDTNSNNISTGSISSTNGLNTSANDDLCGFLNTSFNSGFNRSSQPTPSHNDNNNSNDLYTENPNFNYIARPSHSLVTGPNQKRRTGKSGKHTVSKKSSSRNDTNSNNISTGSISSTNGLNTSANDDLCGFLNTSYRNAACSFLNEYLSSGLNKDKSNPNIHGRKKTSSSCTTISTSTETTSSELATRGGSSDISFRTDKKTRSGLNKDKSNPNMHGRKKTSSSCTTISTSTKTTSSELASRGGSSDISVRTDKKTQLTYAKTDTVTATEPRKRPRKSSRPQKLRLRCVGDEEN